MQASARMLSARRRHLSRRWRNVGPSSRVRVRVRVVPEAAHGVGRCVMPNVCAANARCKTFGTNVNCKTHLFWAAHQQNVPVQNVECKLWRKRLAALAFSPNVLHARSITFACKRSNVKSGLITPGLLCATQAPRSARSRQAARRLPRLLPHLLRHSPSSRPTHVPSDRKLLSLSLEYGLPRSD